MLSTVYYFGLYSDNWKLRLDGDNFKVVGGELSDSEESKG